MPFRQRLSHCVISVVSRSFPTAFSDTPNEPNHCLQRHQPDQLLHLQAQLCCQLGQSIHQFINSAILLAGQTLTMCIRLSQQGFLTQLAGLQINATNLSQNYSLLTGAVTSLGMSLLLCIVISLIFPAKEKFRWSMFTENIAMADDEVR